MERGIKRPKTRQLLVDVAEMRYLDVTDDDCQF